MRSLKLANLWRIIRDVDLEAIRASVGRRFELLVVADEHADAQRVRDLLGEGGPAHPWITALGAEEVVPGMSAGLASAIFVSNDPRLSPALAAARDQLARGGAPIATVIVGGETELLPDPRERVRVAVAALDPSSTSTLAAALLAAASDDLHAALARQLPPLRPAVFERIIEETARANAGFALTTGLAESVPVLTAPLNLGDIVILTKNQLVMSYRLAVIAGRNENPRKMLTEILGVLGGGLLFRQLARQLVGLIPVIGIVPKVAVAYGGTWAIGRAMVGWLTEGRAVTADTVRVFTTEGLARGRDVARRMLKQGRPRGRDAESRLEQ
jgi:uncharacterized protein (DUF697 family)